jgi:hypothetical protein
MDSHPGKCVLLNQIVREYAQFGTTNGTQFWAARRKEM